MGTDWKSLILKKTADYSLLSVLAGEGKLTVDGKDYPIQKEVTLSYRAMLNLGLLEGQGLELIVSHP